MVPIISWNCKNDFYLVDSVRKISQKYSCREEPVHVRLDRFINPIHWNLSSGKYISRPLLSGHHFWQFPKRYRVLWTRTWKWNASLLSDRNLIEDINDDHNGDLSKCPIKDGYWWGECKGVFKVLIIKNSHRIPHNGRKIYRSKKKIS